jgi:hypothetical protein
MLDDAVERMVPDGSGGAVSAHTGGPMGPLPFVVARRGVTGNPVAPGDGPDGVRWGSGDSRPADGRTAARGGRHGRTGRRWTRGG